MTLFDQSFDIASLHAAYRDGLSPQVIADLCFARAAAVDDPGIFIHLCDPAMVAEQVNELGVFDAAAKPLWGVPFAIKDNIDAAGLPTTAGCPAFAFTPDKNAFAVQRLRDAGAILIGKTNLDQFATGLVGVRTPFPIPRNALDPAIVPGGSSSGSAVAVGHGIVSFSLGTDTAGSGRVPAALNNIVGLKPSLGAVSSSGLVPACRSIDTISIFALTVDDAYTAFQAAAIYDDADSYSRPVPIPDLTELPSSFRIGIPDTGSIRFFGDKYQAQAFDDAVDSIEALGGTCVPIDFSPF
ncbi:MAG: amidase family protein, partial [Pseudomonadota bacterium]